MSINFKAIILIAIVITIIVIIPESLALFLIIVAFFFLSPFSNTLQQQLDNLILSPSQLINKNVKKEYLLSDKWQLKRQQRLEYDNYQCCNCQTPKNLEVHHATYVNLYDEPLKDLETLCRTCHQDIHNTHGYSYDTTYPKANELDI